MQAVPRWFCREFVPRIGGGSVLPASWKFRESWFRGRRRNYVAQLMVEGWDRPGRGLRGWVIPHRSEQGDERISSH